MHLTVTKAMKIALVCPVYPPEIVPSAVMQAQLAESLCAKGHHVTVYTTFPSLPQGRVFDGYRRSLWSVLQQGQLRLIRCFSFTIGEKRTRLWRALSHLSFALTSALRLLLEDKPDLIVANMAPVISSPIIVMTAKLLKVPVANNIQDLFPEAVESARMISSGGLAAKIALWIDRITCRMADTTIVLSESFKDALMKTRKVPAEKIEIIRSWVDGSKIKSMSRDNSWRKETEIPLNKFVAMFAGTMGLASGVDVLVDVAAKLRNDGHDDILIVCIGEGLLKPKMVQSVSEQRLNNIVFLPFQPEERLSEVQSTADVFLLPMEKSHAVSSVPSKLITYLAVGRPILAAVDAGSSIAKRVHLANCGLVVPPGDAAEIAKGLIEMKADALKLEKHGSNGRKFFQQYMDMPIALAEFESLSSRMVAGKGCTKTLSDGDVLNTH
ncbi:MAG: glycosyltransferase family 4 protein [Desulfomonile tiedjei]|uniref:Glycosyltransferase family 4 protein n=1 Tax=Desulfomonile tiedjei TaxID=2358 RepID=A0A9D6Z0H6_9BACT|nr:glycosyltransferase family 4 protein [Desulfomonile tiedjei]